MIDRKLLAAHPANRLARAYLRRSGWQAPGVMPLLGLLLAWLDSLPAEAFRGPGCLADLADRARELASRSPAWAAGLLAGNYQELDADLARAPRGREWPALAGHLTALWQDLRRAKSPERAARLLAENLASSLQEVYPDFGPPSR